MLLSHFIQSFVFSQASQVLSALLLEINFQVILADIVKTVHVIFVCAGVGGFLAQMILLQRFKGENVPAQDAAASENMALALTRYVEFYGLLLALISGFGLAFLIGAFKGAGYLHAKIVLVLVLVGLSHFELRNLKRMVALRAEGKTAELNQLKQTHLSLGMFNLLLVAAVIFLVIDKPF